MAVTATQVKGVLEKLGLEAWQAEQAANDPRLAWDEEKLQRCVEFVRASTADRPAAVLWSRTKRGTVPAATRHQLRVVLPAEVASACPVCHDDLAVCGGMHGWAAKFRGMTPAAIFPPPTEEAHEPEPLS